MEMETMLQCIRDLMSVLDFKKKQLPININQ